MHSVGIYPHSAHVLSVYSAGVTAVPWPAYPSPTSYATIRRKMLLLKRQNYLMQCFVPRDNKWWSRAECDFQARSIENVCISNKHRYKQSDMFLLFRNGANIKSNKMIIRRFDNGVPLSMNKLIAH